MIKRKTPGSIIFMYFCPAMIKWLQKILFIAISFSFFISATEMDLGKSHNTFFDEFDTYVKTEQVSLDHATFLQQDDDIYTLTISQYQAFEEQLQIVKNLHLAYCNHFPSKIFLHNSVWRI